MAILPAGFSFPAKPTGDLADVVVTGQFTAQGNSAVFVCFGPFNVVFGGASGPNGSWNATVALERSFDGGVTWYVAGVGGSGSQAIYSTNNQDVSIVVVEVEKGVAYRLSCTAYTSGTINYRISGNGATAMSIGVMPGIF